MSCRISSLTVLPYALPLRAALTTSRGRFAHRHGFLLRVQAAHGAIGWGDVAPWPGFGSSHDEVMLQLGALEHHPAALRESAFSSLEDIARTLAPLTMTVEVRAALEQAMLDLLAQSRGESIAQLLHDADPRATVESQRLAGDWGSKGARDEAWRGWLKLKVGAAPLESDVARVRDYRKQFPLARVKLDANGAWSLAQAQRALSALKGLHIGALEQPLAADTPMAEWQQLRELCHASDVALLADESIASMPALEAFVEAAAIDGVVLKPMFLGGLLPTLEMARRAQQAGLSVCVTSALESAIGRAGVVHLASGLGGVHGLGSLLAQDFAALLPAGDTIACPAGPGLGLPLTRQTPLPIITVAAPAADQRELTASAAPDPYALPQPLRSAALAHPRHPALVSAGRTIDYATLCDDVARLATSLAERGIAATNVVALSGPRDDRWVRLFHALGWLGATVAPLPPGLSVVEHGAWLDAVGADHSVHCGHCDSFDAAQHAAAAERFWPLDERRVVLCTSGTSGARKVISLTSAQLAFSAFGSALRLGHHTGDRWLCCLPLHHVGGLSILLRSAWYGITLVLHESFDEERVARALDDGSVTLVSLVPSMLQRALDAREDKPLAASVRALLLGGAAAPETLVARCRALEIPLRLTWGMTESASQVATQTAAQQGDFGHAGPPLPFARVSSIDGRLAIAGPIVRGQLLTNDLGDNDDGRVVVRGRSDAVIISGGENISPQHIEERLRAHPQVADALVVAVASARWGQRPLALLEARSEHVANDELRSFCRETLPSFMVPDAFVWTPALPRNEMGKRSRDKAAALALDWLREHGSSLINVDEPTAAQPGEQLVSRRTGLERSQIDERVNNPSARPYDAVLTDEFVRQGHRPTADPLDRHRDVDALMQPHGSLEVGLGVHHGEAHMKLVDQPVDAQAHAQQQLLEGFVTQLKKPAEKQDSSAVHLKESDGRAMNESHIDDTR